MPCFHPLQAFRKKNGQKPNGSWPLTFNLSDGDINQPVTIPCGTCDGCRMSNARQWTVRCLNEAQMHERNCFITLTYDENHTETLHHGLNKKDYQLFMKRLRKKYGNNIRFFHCGEYGTEYGRPHHHACLFNHDFDDKYHWQTRAGVHLYRSRDLETLWPYGFCTIGSVTPESAAYVARYVVKKISGRTANFNYQGNTPEYTTMSRRPGIGKPWFDKYYSDVTTQDKVIVNRNLTLRTPKYYDSLYDRINPEHMERIKKDRLSKVNMADNTPERLAVKETLLKIKLKNKKRSYEQCLS
ncbi:MAG: replication initiator protein [Arizlama microvirus]|nr:MAG: replication initiator protein [Arizlama microvirus]